MRNNTVKGDYIVDSETYNARISARYKGKKKKVKVQQIIKKNYNSIGLSRTNGTVIKDITLVNRKDCEI